MMITVIGWIAALVALLTSLAMLKDAGQTKVALSSKYRIVRVRYMLRVGALVMIAASAGVCVFLPFGPGMQASTYEVLLRVALVVPLAIQSPCSWVAYILRGAPSRSREKPHVQ